MQGAEGAEIISIGHNSAAFGQTLKPLKPAAAAKKPKAPRFPYFKFYPRDWMEATREMSLEARGAYIDLICIIMEMEGHLADNDGWISHQMHVSTRKWRAVKKQLVEHEKIRVEDGKIVNERCLKELDSLLAQRRNITESALTRERTKREKSEKDNENNAANTTTVPLRAPASDLDTDLREERRPPTAPERDAVVGGNSGLNGTAAVIVEKLSGWINPMMPDRRTAKGWLDNAVSMYGAIVVRDSFAELDAKFAQGDIVSRPIPYLAAACIRRSATKQSSGPPQEGEWNGKFYINGKERPEPIYRRHVEAKQKALEARRC
jgi:uncharacterized protein YdaU (DUF1376 family)